MLAQLSTITSVSGGSILNGVLAARWSKLKPGPDGTYTNLIDEVAEPTRSFCMKDLRTSILLGTRLRPPNLPALLRDCFSVSANFLAEGYEPLYQSQLSDLPAPSEGAPRFIFCATNVRAGGVLAFHGGPQARMGDFYTGYCDAGSLRVSDAVAASSAFPPGFSAFRLDLSDGRAFTDVDPWGDRRVLSAQRGWERRGLSNQPVLLTDGGVYDNLAVEPVWTTYSTLFVSDAGTPFESERGNGQALIPRLRRAAEISMEQVAAVRKRWLVDELGTGRRPPGPSGRFTRGRRMSR